LSLPTVMENLLNELKSAVKTPVKAGWITTERPPIVTVLQIGGRSRAAGNTDNELRELEFQIDVWANSAKQRDDLAERIVHHFVSQWRGKYDNYGWYAVWVYGLRDMDEENVFRKTMTLVINVWVRP